MYVRMCVCVPIVEVFQIREKEREGRRDGIARLPAKLERVKKRKIRQPLRINKRTHVHGRESSSTRYIYRTPSTVSRIVGLLLLIFASLMKMIAHPRGLKF